MIDEFQNKRGLMLLLTQGGHNAMFAQELPSSARFAHKGNCSGVSVEQRRVQVCCVTSEEL